MNNAEINELTAKLYEKVKADKRSGTEIANLAGVSQPTVSRIKTGKPTRMRQTYSFIKLCRLYRIGLPIEVHSNLVNNQIILNAVDLVWDGTNDHAIAIARVILSLKGMKLD